MSKTVKEVSSAGISRGQLIKGLGVGAAAATLAPTLVTEADAATMRPQTKVKELYRIYLSESTDPSACVFSALLMPDSRFEKSVVMARGFRQTLQRNFGIRTVTDITASKLIGNRGHISNVALTDGDRVQIFTGVLRFAAKTPGAKLLLAVFPSKARATALRQLLIHTNARLHKTSSFGVLICHADNEPAFLPLMHGLHLYNPVAAALDPWRTSSKQTSAISLDRIVGHPRLRSGRHIQFVELSDFIALAELRHVAPSARTEQLQIKDAINLVKPILVDVVRPLL